METEDLSYAMFHGLFSSTEAIKYKRLLKCNFWCQMSRSSKSPFTNRYKKIIC